MKKIISLAIILTMLFNVQPTFAKEKSINTTTETNMQECVDLLHQYAPIIWYSSLEKIFPSSMEEMYECATVKNGKVKYTKVWSKLRGDFSRAKNYAFYCQDDENNIRLFYCQYYMTDPGKGMILCHYGDWESCSIQLKKVNNEWEPVLISYNHHGINTKVAWESSELKKNEDHPIIYAARGSHGIYLSEGIHRYKYFLLDSTNKGTCWNTTECLECYYYDGNELVSIQGSDHVKEFTTIVLWGQSYNSPSGNIIEKYLAN